MKDPDNWEYITSIECIGDRGDILPNMLILSRKQHLKKYFKKDNLKNNVCFFVSDFGYSNDEIGV